jgi:type IV secretion system protein TrbL
MVAAIILAVISHRLPHMVAGMVLGGGHNGAIGGVGVMTLLAAGMTGMGLAGRLSGNPAAALAMGGVGEGAKILQDRIAAAEAAMGGQKSQQSISTDTSGSAAGLVAGGPAAGGSSAPISTKQRGWYARRMAAAQTSGATGAGGKQASGAPATSGFTAEPPQERPMSADEARGFGPDGNGGSDDQPYTPTSDNQIT